MTNDEAKDFVLQYLLDMQTRHPMRHIGYPKAMIIGAANNEDRAVVGMAIDYLSDENYLRTQTQQTVRYYRLSSKAQDKLLPPSAYAKSTQQESSIRMFNNGGIMVLGDNYGTISIDKRIQITNDLEKLAEVIGAAKEINDVEKGDLIQSIATLQSQLKKQTPDKTIVEHSWSSLQGASAVAGTVQLIGQLKPLIEHVIKTAMGG